MTSDRGTDRPVADNTSKNNSVESSTVHLEIDGTMELRQHPVTSQRDTMRKQQDPSRYSHEAALRHVIRLQRQALNKQSLRIQQQRSLIQRLHHSLKKQHLTSQKSRKFEWLRALFPQKPKPNND